MWRGAVSSGQAGTAFHLSLPHVPKAIRWVFGAFVSADQAHLTWTRGQPKLFRSSSKVKRGFCEKCGTPLTYQHPTGVEIAIGAFDNPAAFEPAIQVNHHKRLPWIDTLFETPIYTSPEYEAFFDSIESWQHPDFDTQVWPVEDEA